MAKCRQCRNHGFFLRVDSSGLCSSCRSLTQKSEQLHKAERTIEELKQELESERARYLSLDNSISPDLRHANNLYHEIESMSQRKRELTEDISRSTKRLNELQNQILVASDTIQMESFSLYKPVYSLASSAEYKSRLDDVRKRQKDMIRDKSACVCDTAWSINGSLSDGLKQTNDNIKLFLMAFNLECDAAIGNVKFSNYQRSLDRILKARSTVNSLGRISHIVLSDKYYALKVEELRLVHEYALKKQQEKEEQAEIRRQQREQAKLDKEIAEARKAAEKERQHYEQALANIDAQIVACTDPEQKAALKVKRTEIRDGLDGVEAKLEDIDYRQTNQRAGYVYIISNIGAFGENVYKIGMTRRLNPMERVDELGDASVPFVFDVHAMIFSADAPALESALHRAFEDRRINKVNPRREYFRVTLDEIKEVVKKNHDSSVEFVDVPEASQYRQSIKM